MLIDAYQRTGDALLEKIRSRLLAQKELRQKIKGQAMLTEIIAEVSGLTYAEFAQRAKIAQEANLAQHALTASNRPPRADARPGGK